MNETTQELPSGAQHLRALAATSRAAFDPLAAVLGGQQIACGYVSDAKRGPTKLLIPSDLRLLPCAYHEGAVEKTGPRGSTHNVARRVEPLHLLSDHDFTLAHCITAGITHSASSQPEAVAEQPDWVTYVMSCKDLPRLYSLAPHNIGQAATAFGEFNSPHETMRLLVKAFRGGVEWWWSNADLLLKAEKNIYPNAASGWLVKTARAVMKDKGHEHWSRDQIDALISGLPSKITGGRRTSGHALVQIFSRFIEKQLTEHLSGSKAKETPLYLLPAPWDALAADLRCGADGVLRPSVAAIIETMVKSDDIILVGGPTLSPLRELGTIKFSKNSPICLGPAAKFIEGLDLLVKAYMLVGEPLDDALASAKTLLVSQARDIVHDNYKVDNVGEARGVRLIAEAVFDLPALLGHVTVDAGTLQREEARRMKIADWPHICLQHPDSRSPQMHASFGQFEVYDLPCSRQRRFPLPFNKLSLLCDAKNNFLPYKDAVLVLEAEFNDFGEEPEWGDCPEDFRPALTYALEQKGLEASRLFDVEVDEEAWYPQLTADGIVDRHRLRVEFNIGPERWAVVRYEWCASHTEFGREVFSTAAAFIYSAYSDHGKMCWLQHEGLIGKGDEVYPKEHDPKKDLSPDLHQGFIKFCHHVPEVDGPWGEFNTYDGEGSTYTYTGEDDESCCVVLFRSN